MEDFKDAGPYLDDPLFFDAFDSLLPLSEDCLFSELGQDDLLTSQVDLSSLSKCDDIFDNLLLPANSSSADATISGSKTHSTTALTDHDYLSQNTAPSSPFGNGSDSGLSSTTEECLASPSMFSTSSSSSPFSSSASFELKGSDIDLLHMKHPELLSTLSFDEEELNKAIENDDICQAINSGLSTGTVSPTLSAQPEFSLEAHMDVDVVSLLNAIETPCKEATEAPFIHIQQSPASPALSEDYSMAAGTSTGYASLKLTNEEQTLLDKEGITLPTNMPLTRSEEKVLRAVRRRIRNKESARNSRKKKQVYVDQLEERVKMCAEEKKVLTKRMKELEETNSSLLGQLKKLQQLVATAAQKPVKRSTCAMILALSFAFFLMPSYQSYMSGEDSTDLAQSTPITGKSRSLLMHDETVRKNMPFYKEALQSMVKEKMVDPQELAIQAYITREMKNDTDSTTEFVSVQLTKDKTPIISLHNNTDQIPVRSGTNIKEEL